MGENYFYYPGVAARDVLQNTFFAALFKGWQKLEAAAPVPWRRWFGRLLKGADLRRLFRAPSGRLKAPDHYWRAGPSCFQRSAGLAGAGIHSSAELGSPVSSGWRWLELEPAAPAGQPSSAGAPASSAGVPAAQLSWGLCLKFEAQFRWGAKKWLLQKSLSCHPWVVKIIFTNKIVHMILAVVWSFAVRKKFRHNS